MEESNRFIFQITNSLIESFLRYALPGLTLTILHSFVLFLYHSSGLKDVYSNMVAGEAGPSKVYSENNNDNDTNDIPVKRHCKAVVAEPDRLVSIRNYSLLYIYLLKSGADVLCYTYVNNVECQMKFS